MGLDTYTWADGLLRGGLGGAFFVLLFLAARWRWKQGDSDRGEADIGLD